MCSIELIRGKPYKKPPAALAANSSFIAISSSIVTLSKVDKKFLLIFPSLLKILITEHFFLRKITKRLKKSFKMYYNS
jgi:hypothetical protein